MVRLSIGVTEQQHRKLLLGVDAVVRACFRHAPPSPLELEHAIELTEEVVMPLANQFGGTMNLVLQGRGAQLIAQGLATGLTVQTALTLDAVEALFNRLVAVSEGRPSTQEVLPSDAHFFAAMLVLREVMHHLRFSSVKLQASAPFLTPIG